MINLRALMRQLAELEPGDLPVISAYLDMRPHAAGESPAQRPGLVVLKDRLREIEKTFGPRGPEVESFQADMARIEQYVEQDFQVDADGLAVFACSGRGLFEPIEASVAFDNQVTVGPQPDLFQLARLLDDLETAVVAVVDTNTARLFVTRRGWLHEVPGHDDDPKFYGKRQPGGWSQARYQRASDELRSRFARDVAAHLDRLVERMGATRVLLAGDEVAIPILRAELPQRTAELVHDEVLRIDVRAQADTVQGEIAPILAAVEAEEDRDLADRVVEAVRGDGLGSAGLRATRKALEQGQVDTLLLESSAELDEETRAELVRLAATTSAEVSVVEDHPGLRQLGGVGALLRYRYD
jgi:hypothetical protein